MEGPPVSRAVLCQFKHIQTAVLQHKLKREGGRERREERGGVESKRLFKWTHLATQKHIWGRTCYRGDLLIE